MKGFLQEFKNFALRGNVMDMSVGIIIGGAFQAIVASLTGDIISPLIGLFANTNFDMLSVDVLGVTVKYGSFLTAVINFVIMALIIFTLIKGMNNLATLGKHHKDAIAEPTTKKCPFCTSEIAIEATRCPHCTSMLEEAIAVADAK